jgi:hypothetical protein
MKRALLIALAVVALVLLAATAAYVGGRLFGASDLAHDNSQVILSESGDGVTTSGFRIVTEPAAELPHSAPDVAGIYLKRKDNSLYLGTGNLSATKVGATWEYHHEGPVVEVVTTHETQIYRDSTLQQLGDTRPSGKVQQVLRPSSVEDIEADSTISAWGQRRGDRLVATVIVFHPNG